jgi:hypothetical protein
MQRDLRLDHLVVNTRFATDAAHAMFQELGFTLTPRGFHSAGSINHLMVFDDHYLELIGLPEGNALREEILARDVGPDGLVLRSNDAHTTLSTLLDDGFRAQPVEVLSRPVLLEGAAHMARFDTVRMPGEFRAGRVYFCRHLTPELVWRPEWMQHANGVTGIASLYVIGEHSSTSVQRYRRLANACPSPGTPRFALQLLSRPAFDERFGGLTQFASQREDCFGAIGLHCLSTQAIEARARQTGLPYIASERRVVVALPELKTLLEFLE